MKKAFLSATLLLASVSLSAQNVQIHYDLGNHLNKNLSDRQNVTTTVEMFKPDALGSNFFFVDFDYHSSGVKGAYWEVAREFNVTNNKRWAAHIEYNGGLGSPRNTSYVSRYQNAVLLGGAYNWLSKDYSKNFSVQLMYKRYFKGASAAMKGFNSVQLTEVWGVNFANKLCTFNGFCDIWYDKNASGKLVLISEPQFWVNLNALKGMKDVNLSIGSEVEISNNFVYNNKGDHNKFYAIPTLAAKWTF